MKDETSGARGQSSRPTPHALRLHSVFSRSSRLKIVVLVVGQASRLSSSQRAAGILPAEPFQETSNSEHRPLPAAGGLNGQGSAFQRPIIASGETAPPRRRWW